MRAPSPAPPPIWHLPLPWILAWRFLRGRRSRLLDGTARAALGAITLGVVAMVVAMALMTGYREDLERKLIGNNAPLLASPLQVDAGELPPEVRRALEELPGVERVGAVIYGQGVLSSQAVGQGLEVVLRGVDPGGGQLAAQRDDFEDGASGVPGVVVGEELAHRLGIAVGDIVSLVVLGFEDDRPRFRYQSLRVSRLFETGFAEFDAEWVLLERSLVRCLVAADRDLSLYELTLDDPREAPRIAEEVRSLLGQDYLVTDWRELNRELFTALRVQQILLFLVLGLIVLVSTFNVASTLVVLVRERMRDIGALGAMGLAPARLRAVFLLYGGGLGVVGVAVGTGLGAGAAYVLDTYELIRFNAEVAAIYFIRSVPFRVTPGDLLAVVGFALGVNLIACLAPAWRASRVDPSSALRYE